MEKSTVKCLKCNGSGFQMEFDEEKRKWMLLSVPCGTCKGTGKRMQIVDRNAGKNFFPYVYYEDEIS